MFQPQADELIFGTDSEGEEANESPGEAGRLIAAHPELHLELTKLLSAAAHLECPALEMDDSMSDANSSGVSDNISTPSDSSDSP